MNNKQYILSWNKILILFKRDRRDHIHNLTNCIQFNLQTASQWSFFGAKSITSDIINGSERKHLLLEPTLHAIADALKNITVPTQQQIK